MTEREVYDIVLVAFGGTAVIVFPLLLFVTAPYGRHMRPGFGLPIPNRWGWVLMELPAPLGMLYWFMVGGRFDAVSTAFLLVWELHYCQRTFIFPLLMNKGNPLPLTIVLFGFLFNLFNTYVNGRWLFAFSSPYPFTWFYDPRFLIGSLLFLAGFAINIHSDHILRSLRTAGDTTYKIPMGGMFRYVSAANYFGELLEWLGWAVLTWSLPGAIFAFWTFANLGPRAIANHKWYREKFPDYPKERRALIPFIL